MTFPGVSSSPLKAGVAGAGGAGKSTASAEVTGSVAGGVGASPRKVKAISDMNLTQMKFRELEIQQQHVHELHREFSQRKTEAAKQAQRLSEVSVQLSEAQDKLRTVLAQTQEAEQRDSTLRKQEDEIARARASVAERHQYMRTLHQMVDRLVRSRLACEGRVEALRVSNGEARKELSAALQRLRKADAGEVSAREELARVRARAADQRVDWESRLAERREAMVETSEVLAFREAQLAAKSAIIAQVKGDLDTEGEQRLTRKVVTTKLRTIMTDGANVRRIGNHGDLELAFRRIVEATGITSMSQVLDKFLNQAENVKSLNMMIDEATSKITQLQEARGLQRRGAEALRFEGALGAASAQRKAIDEREVEIDAVAKTNKRLAERLAMLQSVVRGIRAAILHINRSLDAHQIPDVPGNPVSGEPLAPSAASDDGGAGSEPQGSGGGAMGYSDEPGEAEDGRGDGGTGAGGGASGARAQGQLGGGRGDIEWFVQALAACEQRTLKLVEMLPSRDVRIDDVDAKTLDRFAFIKTALDMGREDPRSLASKVAVKKLLKGGTQQAQQQQPRRPVGHLPRSAVKRLQLVEQCSRHEALAAAADQSVADAERIFRHTREVTTSLPEQLLSTEQKLHLARDEAREARRVAQLFKDQLEQLDAGEIDLPSDEETDVVAAEEEEELDEFERSVTMIGDKEGRDIIKAENRRILQFAEKKRAARKPSPTASASPADEEVIAAVKSETRRTSVIRPQRQTRLQFIKQAQEPLVPAPILRPPPAKQGDTGKRITTRSLSAASNAL